MKNPKRFFIVIWWIPFIVIGLFITLWTTIEIYFIFEHNTTLHRLEKVFATIPHLDGTELIAHLTYLGDDPFVNGHGNDACHYYVAEVRKMSYPLDQLGKHYKNFENKILDNFVDDVLETVPVTTDAFREYHLTIPISGWVYEYATRMPNEKLYIIYMRKTEEPVAGDYRCWRD